MANILIIEDSAFQRQWIVGLLDQNFEILEAENGRQGLEMAESMKPDCILLDLLMPEMGGIEVLEAFKEKGLKIPVVVLTSDIQEPVKKKCLELGARDFLGKPPEQDRLLEILQKVINENSSGVSVSPYQLDALKELFNIGVGRAAKTLSDMVNTQVLLDVPALEVFQTPNFEKLKEVLRFEKISGVKMKFHGAFNGAAILAFPPKSAAALVAILTDQEEGPTTLDAVRAGTLTEVGNIILNSVLGSITNILNQKVDFSLPKYLEGSVEDLLGRDEMPEDVTFILAKTSLKINEWEITGTVMVVFKIDSFNHLLQAIDKK